jgi:AcrR family transcriptional regulator
MNELPEPLGSLPDLVASWGAPAETRERPEDGERPPRRRRAGAAGPAEVLPRELTPRWLARQAQLRAVAAGLFARFGVKAVGIDRLAETQGAAIATTRHYYRNRYDLLTDLLDEHVRALNAAVCAAFDAAAPEGPAAQLEAAAGAYLETAATRADAHRTLGGSAHLLAEQPREGVAIKHRIVFETVMEPVTALFPALALGTEAYESVLASLVALLSDPSFWPVPPEAAERRRRARRIAGMVLAAAAAESAGDWAGLGGRAGASGRTAVRMDATEARARFREVLARVEAGQDVVIARRERVVARVVRAGEGCGG